MSSAETIREVREAVWRGDRSAVEICEGALARIETLDPKLNAFNAVTRDRALERAARIDRSPGTRRDLPLAGVPVALKDNLCTKDVPTTASSRILEGFRPPFDATVVRRLEEAGAVVVGKTSCDEFAMGSSNETSAFGPVHNPWALDRIPGGSSGGSAVAVAIGMTPLALGSDTGGSVRQPAAHCGIVGLKPTYGRVSRYGLIAFASSLDQIGPLTGRVSDAAIALSVVAGFDGMDATSSPESVPDYTAALTGDINGTRIGVPASLLDAGIDREIARAFREALNVLVARGASLIDVELPHARSAVPVYYLVATAEASSNLARYDGVRYGYRAPQEGPARAATPARDGSSDDLRTMYAHTRARGFGPEVKRRIMLGTYVLSAGYYDAYYLKAQQVRTLIRRDYDEALARADVVVMPTSPVPAFKLGERTSDPLQMYLTDIFTVSANLAGLPAVSVPCGFTPEGLPVGLQLTGRVFEEGTILRIADAYERDTGWWKRRPVV